MLSTFRARLLSQRCWSISRSLPILLERRTLTFSSVFLQQSNSPPTDTNTSKKTSSILGNDDEQAAKTPFIFGKTSTDLKYNKTSDSKKETDDEKREREARAAWDMRMLRYTSYFLGIWLFSTAGYVILVWGSPQVDHNGNIIEDQYSSLPKWQQYIKRSFGGLIEYWQTIKDPTSDKLLPEPLPAPYQPQYTLVIEMSGVLLHPEWNYNTGWRFKKRPGLDYFLKEIGYPAYEVVIYTKETPWQTQSVIENMDHEHRIMYRLFRENTRFINGAHVKDLSCLNRDLKKIIYLDWDDKAFQLQPRNALHRLKKWDGDDEDRQLIHLATFLRMIAASGVEDVRDVLDHYNQEPDPVQAFLLRQQKLLEAEEQRRQAAAKSAFPAQQSKGLFGSFAKRF